MTPTIQECCKAYDIEPVEFYDETIRSGRVLACRIYAIARLRSKGLSNAAIARDVGRGYDFVRYWINPQHRERRKQNMRRRYYESTYGEGLAA
jgi:hypothetical protein